MNKKIFAAGFLGAALLFTAGFAQPIQKMIEVSYQAVNKIIIEGYDKTPEGEKQPFVYDGTTYVPIRYISESMYKNVYWDGESRTIIISGVNVPEEDKTAIYSLLDNGLNALAKEDINTYMGLLSKSLGSVLLDSAKQATQSLFSQCTLEYEVVAREFINYTPDFCQVKETVIARAVEGSYQNNKTTSVIGLVKEDGRWKYLYSSVISYEETE